MASDLLDSAPFELWKTEQLPVPNHIIESKIYPKVSRNSLFAAQPDAVHFPGFEVGVPQTQILRLMNVSDQVQRLHIIPPQTRYFTIYYKKRERLVSGFSVDVTVTFTADENRYFYDAIRVHCKNEENLVIPLHAYPIMTKGHLPENLIFKEVPLGFKKTKAIPLTNESPVSFEFRVVIMKPHESFTIEPLSGVVPPRDRFEINVTFSPTAFATAHLELQIETSQYRSKPFLMHITGNTRPGIERELYVKQATDHLNKLNAEYEEGRREGAASISEGDEMNFLEEGLALDPDRINLLEMSRERKGMTFDRTKGSKSGRDLKSNRGKWPAKAAEKLDEVEADGETLTSSSTMETKPHKPASIFSQRYLNHKGYRIPTELNNPTAVAFVLSQEPEKVRITELRDVKFASDSLEIIPATRQIKETLFEKELRLEKYNERQNRLRWMTKLGELAMTNDAKRAVREFRTQALAYYRSLRLREPLIERELQRFTLRMTEERTIREYDQIVSPSAGVFDAYRNSITEFPHKKRMREKFVSAARAVIMRNRLTARLACISAFVREVKQLEAGGKKAVDYETLLNGLLKARNKTKTKASMATGKGVTELIIEEEDEDEEGGARMGYAPRLAPDSVSGAGGRAMPFRPQFSLKPIAFLGDQKRAGGAGDGDESEEKKPCPIPESFEEIIFRQRLPVFEFKVPQYYKAMQFSPYDTHEAEHSYTPLSCPRTLRRGPEEQPGFVPDAYQVPPPKTPTPDLSPTPSTKAKKALVKKLLTKKGKIEPEPAPPPQVEKPKEPVKRVPLPRSPIDPAVTTPVIIFRPVEYPRMHIMNPAPGLLTYLPSVYYSEIDIDRGLVPIATETMEKWAFRMISSAKAPPSLGPGTGTGTAGGAGAGPGTAGTIGGHATADQGALSLKLQGRSKSPAKDPKYVDRNDVIKGMMSWRDFNTSSGAGSLPSLASYAENSADAQTRWSDRCSTDLLPNEGIPELFDSLPEDDLENIVPADQQPEAARLAQLLTPQMVAQQFVQARDSLGVHGLQRKAAQVPGAGGHDEDARQSVKDASAFDRFGIKIREREANMKKYVSKKDLFQ